MNFFGQGFALDCNGKADSIAVLMHTLAPLSPVHMRKEQGLVDANLAARYSDPPWGRMLAIVTIAAIAFIVFYFFSILPL